MTGKEECCYIRQVTRMNDESEISTLPFFECILLKGIDLFLVSVSYAAESTRRT